MRASTVAIILAAAAATPALAAPQYARENALLARQNLQQVTETTIDPSEAINFGSIFKIGGDVIDGLGKLFGGSDDSSDQQQQQKRELLEHFARQVAANTDASGAFNFGSLFKIGGDVIDGLGSLFGGNSDSSSQQQQKRELLEHVARQVAASTDASGAINFGSLFKIGGDVIDGLGKLFGGSDDSSDQQQQQKRELLEHVARQVAANTDASGAFNFGSLFKIGGDVIDGLGSLFGGNSDSSQQQQKREIIEHFARQVAATNATAAQSGAFNFGSLFKIGGDVIDGISSLFGGSDNSQQQQKREMIEHFARAVAASAAPQSGAFDFGSLISGLFSFLKREDMELLARGTAAAPQSGAFDFGSLISGLFSFLKREDMELLARDATAASSQSGAFDFGSLISGLFSFLKREDMELLARDATAASSQSGAFDFGSLISGLFSFLKREDMEIIARDATAAASQSGAFDFGSLISGLFSFLKREDTLAARDTKSALALSVLKNLASKHHTREFQEVMVRGFVDEWNVAVKRSLNELD